MKDNGRQTLVIAGMGMAGAKLVEEIQLRAPDRFHIRMFGAERCGTYNRLLLSSVLGGYADPEQLWLNPLEWYADRGIYVHAGVRVENIDRQRQVVTGGAGKVEEPYDMLVLATGSSAVVPALEGIDKRGVFVFRTIEDCQKIVSYAENCARAVVIGGGVAGLEAAQGLLSHGLAVTVIESAPRLMFEQLDAQAGALLKRKLESLGVDIEVNATVKRLEGDEIVQAVRLGDGTSLPTDMAVFACANRPNAETARDSGLAVNRAIVVDDQLRTSDPTVFALGECAEHRGKCYGHVQPVYEQAEVLADVVTQVRPDASYLGTRLTTSHKVMHVELTSMGEVHGSDPENEIVSHFDPSAGIYKKLVIRDNRLVGAILLGAADHGGKLQRLYKTGAPLPTTVLELLDNNAPPDAPPLETVGAHIVHSLARTTDKNKIETIKREKDGLDSLPDILRLAENNRWEEMTEADKQRAKWHGLFFRTPTPGNFMMRIRFEAGKTNSKQFRVLADLTDQYGKGFCDLTTRQQIQLRWFTLADVADIWKRLDEVGLHSKQTGMDNVRGICGCPVAGLTPHELFDASSVIKEFNALIVDNREFTNLPRKFNVTITGCLENCCHTETQDIALVPAFRELDGQQVNGFNVLVGGKQGSGGYRPATPANVFVRLPEAARLCGDIARIFREHGSRETRTRARMAFLIEDRGIAWFRNEMERLWKGPLWEAGTDLRKKNHVDHLGIHPQKKPSPHYEGPALHYVGMLVPVGRITTKQMRGVADIADNYGNGDIRVTVGQNLIVANIPEPRIGALTDEPIFKEFPFDPSPIMRGLVTCTGNDFCALALIDTKGYAIQVAQELEKRTQGRRVLPLTMHWSGCPAGCGLHQVATIGLQGCRSRVNGKVVDSAHVCVQGRSGPDPVVATDLLYDVPVAELADALEPLVSYLPRK